MSRIFLSCFLFLFSTALFAQNQWPAPQGYVNDFAKVLSPGERQNIESFLGQVEQQTGSQIAVVTTPSVDEGDIDGAAADLFKKWGVGQKGKDNGALILVAVQDHKMRIEVGYGLESVITDGTAGDIIRNEIRPSFKQGDYAQGLTNGAVAVAQLIAQSEGVTLNGQLQTQNSNDSDPARLIIFIVFIAFILLNVIFRMLGGRFYGGGWGGGGFYGGGWGGGGFGGSSGGGGFGGFGGGGSGGGGASGGW